MPFENDTNHKRVAKMQEILGLIIASAESNKASNSEIDQMLAPIVRDLTPYATAPKTPAEPQVEQPVGRTGLTAPAWASVRDMAQKASLQDLTAAMAVYLSRIDDELHQPTERRRG